MNQLERIQAALAERQAQSLLRVRRTLNTPCAPHVEVDGRPMLAFCSNDYLGLANAPELAAALADGAARWGAGAGASHLVSGHFAVHEALEHRLAQFLGVEAALSFSTGYMVNAGIAAALTGRGDAIFADKLNHASLVDGAQLSRASHHRYAHGDMAALARLLEASDAPRKLILTDSVFSMDGDIAPLTQLLALAEQHDAWLVVDDAHGFGVLGPQGRGALAEAGLSHWRLLTIGTLGKAAGLSGAFVAGQREVIEFLMQHMRTYIFTTASAPAIAHALLRSIDLIEAADDRRATLLAHQQQLFDGLHASDWTLMPSRTPIQPVQIGENAAALNVARQLWDQGIWVPAIRPPTVPQGTARLRISLTAAHTAADVGTLVDALRQLRAGQ
jgi:8-amino-7-oxononanoate synthase